MHRRTFIRSTVTPLISGLTSTAGVALAAEPFPSRPVTVVVPFAPAGGADTLARILAGPLGATWKQTVVVENRPGASGKIGTAQVTRAVADGHTLVMASTAAIDRDNLKLLAPVALVSAAPYVVTVRPGLGVRSVQELMNKARAEPGKLTFGSSGEGAASHLSVELFKQMAGLQMLHVPYKGTGQAVTDLLAGTIDFMFAPPQSVMPHVKAGKLLALAVTSAKRARSVPELPPVAEVGLPGYVAVGWFGLLAPAATPKAVVARISQDVNVALKTPEVIAAMLNASTEPAEGSPEDFARFIQEEMARWGPLEDTLSRQRGK